MFTVRTTTRSGPDYDPVEPSPVGPGSFPWYAVAAVCERTPHASERVRLRSAPSQRAASGARAHPLVAGSAALDVRDGAHTQLRMARAAAGATACARGRERRAHHSGHQ